MLLKFYFCIFIESQPKRSPENNPECNWLSQEVTSATKDYHTKQQRSFHQPSKCSGRG